MTDTTEQPNGDLWALIARMIQRLRAEGTVPGIAIGERAPEFELPDAHGNPVSLGERLAAGPVVLSFYRGAWCPVCNTELTGLQAALPAIVELGASLVAISPQTPDASQPFVQRLGLGFDVLSDLDQTTIRAYRLQFALDEELRPLYRSFGLALDEPRPPRRSELQRAHGDRRPPRGARRDPGDRAVMKIAGADRFRPGRRDAAGDDRTR